MAQLGMEKEALAALERGLQAYPSHSRLHRVRAEVYLRFGHRDKAIEAARRAVEFGFLDLEQDRQFLLQLEGGRP
jgi:Tfp pilus assembly protein PilF